MSQTVIRGTQILNNTVQRQDLDTSTVGQAVVTKLVQGTSITLNSTGADAGTGDVTVSLAPHEASHVTGSDQIPLASSLTKGLLNQTSGNTTDFIDGTNNSQALQPVIWSVGLRAFNSLINGTYEVDQRSAGATVAGASGLIQDGWNLVKVGTMVLSAGQNNQAAGEVLVPGTNFRISRCFHRITLTTAQASLGASDQIVLTQAVEGTRFRELQTDVHSVSLLVRSSIAGLKFTLGLRDPPVAVRSLVKLCTIPSANTWTLIPLANLPLWDSGGAFTSAVGSVGYQFGICLAAGTTVTAPAADTWQTGSFVGAPGMSNFANNATGTTTFDIAFTQHQPGATATTLIDLPWLANYQACLRYFAKSYDYDVAIGATNAVGDLGLVQQSTTAAWGSARFPCSMAKIPVCTSYNPVNGVANSAQVVTSGGGPFAVTGFTDLGKNGFLGVAMATLPAVIAGAMVRMHYTADTGW